MGKQKIILDVPIEKSGDALEAAQTFSAWYDTPDWDKKKITFDKWFTVHETQTGTIVVNSKNIDQ
jgi:hypothetical protein